MNPGSILRDPGYPALKQYVLEHTGLAYYADKDEDLATRIARRMTARLSRDVTVYTKILMRDPAEMDCLVGELTIGETYFFRQKEHFDLLRDTIVPELLNRKALSRGIRIWSAGCATGAEPYSIALLLALEFERALAHWNVTILATDINVDFLAQAKTGLFGEWALRDTPPDIRARCFRQEGKRWTLLPEFRGRVAFRYHNLAAGADPAPDHLPFDLILCRNVLIYFAREQMREVAVRLHRNLEQGGWLLVGHAEPNAETFGMFEAITGPAGTVYRKGASHTGLAPAMPTTDMAPVPDEKFVPFLLPDLPPELRISAPAPAIAGSPEALGVDDIRLLADSGRWDKALDQAEKLVTADPLNSAAQFTLGLILEHAGSHENARAALRRAIYLDRGFALAHYNLGTSLAGAGDVASARRSFANVLGLVSSLPAAEPLPHGDGITAAELRDLARMHLELTTA